MTHDRTYLRPSAVAELERYFQCYESDLGLRSAHAALVDLASTGAHLQHGGRANSVDAAMASRLDRPAVQQHRVVHRALGLLEPRLWRALALAHGVHESAWPAPVRLQFGLAAGVALVTAELAEAHVVARVGGSAAASPLEWLVAASVKGSPAMERIRLAAEALLAEAHAAYRATRREVEPKREIAGRAEAGRRGAVTRWEAASVVTPDVEVP